MSAVVSRIPTTESPASRDGSLARLQPEPALQKKRFYLPEVDGIRRLAVLLVWIHHYPEGARTLLAPVCASGWVGVNIFLVLSSFLTTFLLMLEAQTKGSIAGHVSRFEKLIAVAAWKSRLSSHGECL